MTRAVFERQLAEIQEDMLVMASMVETAITQSIQALGDRDVALARRIIENDANINRRRYDLEEKCVELISLQTPLATDLRTIISVLHMAVDLERMGDHAEGIARIAVMLADEPPIRTLSGITQMAETAVRMLHGSLEAYKARDTQRAREIVEMDDEVDALYEQFYHEMFRIMVGEPATIQRATYMLWAAHNLERIADRATNVCEAVIYLVEGRIKDLNVSKY